jgi:hypothetical protein
LLTKNKINIMGHVKTYSEFLNESTTLNTLGLSQNTIKKLSGGLVKSHNISYTPFPGSKTDIKNELVKGSSIIAKRDADNLVIVNDLGGRSKPQYQVIIIKNADIELNQQYSMTQALGFITKEYNQYFIFDKYENTDPSKEKKSLGRGTAEEGGYYTSAFSREKWVQDFVLKIVETQLDNLRNDYVNWLKNYDGVTSFQRPTPIGTTNWTIKGVYRIEELIVLINAIKGNGEFGRKSGAELVEEFLDNFVDTTGWTDAKNPQDEKNALKVALANAAKTIHWGTIAKGYGYYSGLFASEKQLKEELVK